MESEDIDSQLYSRLQESSKITPPEQLQVSIATLFKLLQNINDHPEEAKFRSIKRSNKVIQSKLLSTHNMPDILALVGFQPIDSDVIAIQNLEHLDVALTMLQVFQAELADSMKTEEEKEHERKKLEIRRQQTAKEDAKKRLLEQAALDRKETNTKMIPTQDSHAIHRGPGQARTFKDIGVDLNTVKKG